MVKSVVEAWVKNVVEVMTMVSLRYKGVVVLWLATPLYVEGVKGQAAGAGHVVLHTSPVRHNETAESCVVEAYRSCEVEDA